MIEKIKNISFIMRLALYCERRWSGPWAKLMQLVAPRSVVVSRHCINSVSNDSISYDELSPRAQRIFDELKAAIGNKKELL
jgi:hypothetical protein